MRRPAPTPAHRPQTGHLWDDPLNTKAPEQSSKAPSLWPMACSQRSPANTSFHSFCADVLGRIVPHLPGHRIPPTKQEIQRFLTPETALPRSQPHNGCHNPCLPHTPHLVPPAQGEGPVDCRSAQWSRSWRRLGHRFPPKQAEKQTWLGQPSLCMWGEWNSDHCSPTALQQCLCQDSPAHSRWWVRAIPGNHVRIYVPHAAHTHHTRRAHYKHQQTQAGEDFRPDRHVQRIPPSPFSQQRGPWTPSYSPQQQLFLRHPSFRPPWWHCVPHPQVPAHTEARANPTHPPARGCTKTIRSHPHAQVADPLATTHSTTGRSVRRSANRGPFCRTLHGIHCGSLRSHSHFREVGHPRCFRQP